MAVWLSWLECPMHQRGFGFDYNKSGCLREAIDISPPSSLRIKKNPSYMFRDCQLAIYSLRVKINFPS